ncbi:MAG: translation initiation factor IF-3 [Solirubrobacteraceae bacterium]|nr:translation initiation factor IF-3 [Solirubrobacteraceae bacterium]
MPVPRRFDRRPPERDLTRINERIRVPEVRVIGDDGAQIGIMRTDEAMRLAQQRDLDLVEVAPDARPPVCRILDYSKYKYEQAQKQKAARKHQQKITIREIKFRPKIAEHDYATKKGHVQRFLRGKDKVKVTIMFRGRETTHPERGQMILDRLAGELEELAVIEQRPNLEGRNMTMVLGPSKAVLAGEVGKQPEDGAEAPDLVVAPEDGTQAADAAMPADGSQAAAPADEQAGESELAAPADEQAGESELAAPADEQQPAG